MSPYKRYLLSVLLVILAFNCVDRWALGLLLQDIKVDLQLTDTQLGFLTGIAFALFYSVMGLPIARWADRGNRVRIIAITTALWSAAVATVGLAGNFLQLLLIRIGIGVGEAGCVPPALSLIADHFNRVERPRAVAIYELGIPLSAVIGYFGAGWLNELYGWRTTFMVLGVPGLAIAALAGLTLREPRQRESTQAPAAAPQSPNLREVCSTLWANITFRNLVFAYAVGSFFSFGIEQWKPAFFVRSYGIGSGALGTWFAVIYGVTGLIGTYWGGQLASRYAAGNERRQLQAIAILYCAFVGISAAMYLSSSISVAFALMGLGSLGATAASGPLFATLQTLVPERMRAVSIALLLLFANLVGLGLGPLAAGAMSDALRPFFKEESLRYALLALSPGYLWCAWHLWRASQTVARDLPASLEHGST